MAHAAPPGTMSALLRPPPAPSRFFWGVNFEVGYVPLRVSEDRYASELRGIAGYRNGAWLFAINPNLRWALSGPNSSATPGLDLNFVIDCERKGFGVNFGIGRGLTSASDQWVVKTIISIPLKW